VKFANASGEVEDAIYDAWKLHIIPSGAIVGMEAAARAYNQAGHRLDKTVAAAKAAGHPGRTSAAPSASAGNPHANGGPRNSPGRKMIIRLTIAAWRAGRGRP
jgi:hypothetical protein